MLTNPSASSSIWEMEVTVILNALLMLLFAWDQIFKFSVTLHMIEEGSYEKVTPVYCDIYKVVQV